MSSINPSAPSRFVFVESSAHMPNSVKAAYDWCAVVEVDADFTGRVLGISTRYRGVRAVVQTWDPYPRNGKTPASARVQAHAEAHALVAARNA
jgi:hypothetical protein